MRLVSQEINTALNQPHASANFGLIFNKWLEYPEDRGVLQPLVKKKKQSLISAYNGSKDSTVELLKKKHLRQASYCRAMEQVGWRSLVVHARLVSPFVSGLGASHPTETGMVLDHTTGVPYIPAASQKGVLRLAHIINTLVDDDGTWKDPQTLLDEGIVKNDKGDMLWQEDAAGKTLFGYSEKQNARAGQAVVLDAYPLTPPDLGEEILNPHYSDYYQGNRGPTEDQSPVPVKFLVVRPGAEFVFRLLLRMPFAPQSGLSALESFLRKALERALTEEGFGAKTALGFGRFAIVAMDEAEEVGQWGAEEAKQKEKERLANDPEAQRQEKLTAFVNRLPKAADLPSQASQLLHNIAGFEDALLKDCLLEFRNRYKAQMKKAKKNKKKWVETFAELSKKVNLDP